ncbi:MAG: methyltransferase domain-containing protein [Nitrosopumilus sp. H8]|nr:MAG: methyltransferase domain-containing protein [Nitrosopumilus sp. H13]RNJ78028.1 MAG: methyltransferase domain-containing protein [Nitrosopumilus sp. H8]
MGFSHSRYKQSEMDSWNEVAPRYHKRWAGANRGPFESTAKLVRETGIKKGDAVLDVACGTGAVTKEIARRVGSSGRIVGVDTSSTAIRIARRENRAANIDFVNADAERFGFSMEFDAVTCQYALFFFPSAQRALKNMKRSLRRSGRLGITVHGNNTPFYTSIIEPVSKFVPDYVRPGSPRLDRYGTKSALAAEVKRAGFGRIVVKEFVFRYSPGTFESYWRRYTRYIAAPLKEKLGRLELGQKKELKRQVRERTLRYLSNGVIVFPWQVLILTARR